MGALIGQSAYRLMELVQETIDSTRAGACAGMQSATVFGLCLNCRSELDGNEAGRKYER